jgi:hypothetical protein
MTWWAVFFLFFSWTKRLGNFPSGDGSLIQPSLRPWDHKRSLIQTQGCAGDTLAGHPPGGCQWLVRSGVLLCFKRRKKIVKILVGLFS